MAAETIHVWMCSPAHYARIEGIAESAGVDTAHGISILGAPLLVDDTIPDHDTRLHHGTAEVS